MDINDDSYDLQEAECQGKHLIFFTGPSPQYKANAAVLVSEHMSTADRIYWVLLEKFLSL